MICGKCKNTVPDNFAFCPYCGQKVEAPAPEEKPVIARSAMPKEEEYAGRYETGDMPEPVIRFSKNLASQEPAAPPVPPVPPVQQPIQKPVTPPAPPAPAAEEKKEEVVIKCACGAALREGAKFCTTCGKPVEKKVEAPVAPPAPPVQKPVAPPAPPTPPVPPVQQPVTPPAPPAPAAEEKKEEAVIKCACGAALREGAKFCTTCGKPVEKKVEAPMAPPAPPVQKPVAPPAPPTPPAPPAPPVQQPVTPPAPPAPVVQEKKEEGVIKCACGATLREGAKFCTTCGKPVEMKTEAPVAPPVQKPVAPPAPPVPPVQQPVQKPVAPPAPPVPPMQPVQKPIAPPVPPVQQPIQKPVAPPAPPVPPVQQPVQKPVAPPAPPAQQPAVKKCPLCGAVVPADAPACSGCGVSFRVQQPAQRPVAPAPGAAPVKAPKAKKSAAPLIVGIVAVLLIIGIVVAGFMTNWFGLAGGPLDTVYNATNATLRSGSFHVEFLVSVNKAMEVTGSADCIIDTEEKELTLLAEARAMGETIQIGVLDGKAVMVMPGGYVDAMDFSEQLDMIFEELEDEMTPDEAVETIVEVALEASGLDEMVDTDKAIDCVDKSLNSASWMKKNAGYSTESDGGVKLHVFQPKIGDLLIAALEALEPAFEDPDELEEGLEYFEDMKSEMNDMAEIDVALGVKGGKLVKAEGNVDVDGQEITFEVTFEDIGSAKVDTDAIEDLMKEAE